MRTIQYQPEGKMPTIQALVNLPEKKAYLIRLSQSQAVPQISFLEGLESRLSKCTQSSLGLNSLKGWDSSSVELSQEFNSLKRTQVYSMVNLSWGFLISSLFSKWWHLSYSQGSANIKFLNPKPEGWVASSVCCRPSKTMVSFLVY